MGYTVAVAGVTGAVGREMLKVLQDRSFPVDELRLFASPRSAGRKLDFNGSEVEVKVLSEEGFDGVDFALFALKSGLARDWAPKAAKRGAVVIDNSSAFRGDPEVPLVVPEVNAHRAREHKGIIANPNCSTIQMVVALAPLHRVARVKKVVVATYQAVSGAGQAAMDELAEQSAASLEKRNCEPRAFQHPIAFNIIPHIADFDENGYTAEEMKMVNETRKILEDPDILVSATCVRIPVFRAHSEAVHVELEKALSVEEAREILASGEGITIVDDPARNLYPMPLTAIGEYDVFIGRLRKDLTSEKGLEMWVVADQLLKGAALNALQIAETLASSA
ncbi:MAG: aspartate-semialdehyde dehydrogenase [Planctomycetota bacterium]